MLKAYKYRICPNNQQIEFLNYCFGCTRFIYNKMLGDKISHYNANGEMLKTLPACNASHDRDISANMNLLKLAG